MKSIYRATINAMSLLLVFHLSASALIAPYLISTTAQSDSSVVLSWRNNDIATIGFLIERKDSSETAYHFIDSVISSSTSTYTDLKNLKPQTRYTYRIKGYNATTISDTSNHLEVVTLALSLRKAGITLVWNIDTSQSVHMIIHDSSKCETGYKIFRSDGIASPLIYLSTIHSSNPIIIDSITWYDSTAQINTWYAYSVAAYTAKDSLYSDTCFAYTFKDYHSNQVTKFTRISDFPLSTPVWSAKAGDSIILKESNSPAGKYSVIDVNDPAKPVFAGYIDSSMLLSYAPNTLIPIFLKFGIANEILSQQAVMYKGQLIKLQGNSIKMYSTEANFTLIDSLSLITNNGINLYFINDSILCVYSSRIFPAGDYSYSFVKVTQGNLSFLPEAFYDGTSTVPGHASSTHVNPQGFTDDNTIIITSDYSASGSGFPANTLRTHYVYAYDINSNRLLQHASTLPFSETRNTGLYLSSTENLNVHYPSNVTELFISNVNDSRGYQTALRNNGIFVDSTIPLNTLQNIFADTLSKRIYIISQTRLTILNYAKTIISVLPHTTRHSIHEYFHVSSSVNGSTVKFAHTGPIASSFEVCIYDLSGRMIDRVDATASNEIYWKPKYHTAHCLIAAATFGKQRMVSRFVVRN